MVVKAIVSALGMFVSVSDITDLKSTMKDSPLFMTPFTLVHLAALFISATFVLKVFGYRLNSWWRIWWHRRFRNTYIFWGVNENSMMLAESIHAKEGATGCDIFFVELPEADDKEELLFRGIFSLKRISRDAVYRMEKIDAYLLKARCSLKDAAARLQEAQQRRQSWWARRAANFYKIMGVGPLARFAATDTREPQKLPERKVHHHFLSDSERENLNNMMDFIALMGEKSLAGKQAPHIYCHARRGALCAVIAQGIERIHFADSSQLSVRQLQENPWWQPAHFVDIDTEQGVVTSPFEALVIGFGETGRDAFKFLYEFSAFMGPDGEPSPRTIHVVDRALSGCSPKFLHNCPALRDRGEIRWWEDMSVDSEPFWQRIREHLDRLNYIVIALDDDKAASELAVKLYETAYRARKDMRHFAVFVRQKECDSAELLDRVAGYYCAKSNREDRDTKRLIPFGTYRKLFDIEIFETEVNDAEAEAFDAQYSLIYNEISANGKQDKGASAPLEGAAKELKESFNKAQNISNARHVATKLLLSGALCADGTPCDQRIDDLRKIALREGLCYPNAPAGSPAYRLMENLSLTEHLRWNSRTELLGFVRGAYCGDVSDTVKDYVRRTHECLVPCSVLNDTATYPKFDHVKLYDWGVVELSFKYEKPARRGKSGVVDK